MTRLIQRDAVHNNILDQVEEAQRRLNRLETYALTDVPSEFESPFTINGIFTYPGERVAVISGHGTTAIAPEGLIEFRNPTDGTGATRYNGEVHLYLRAGLTQNERRYLNFRKYDDTADDLILGCNASDVFIVYDGLTHRVWFEKNGRCFINAADDKGVYINYHASDTVGIGGFFVYRGGAITGNNALFGVQLNTPGNMDSQTNVYINSGATGGQNSYLMLQDRGTTKYYLGKHNSGSFALYDVTNSEYALWYDVTAKGLAIGHAIPAARLHPITIDAGTNAVVNVGILGHSTSGTAAAGFGTGLLFQAEDATVDKREMGRLTYAWISATDASRAARGTISAYSTSTEQTAMQWDGDAGGVKLGFRGSAPVAKETVTGSRGGNAALADLLTKLANLGLITDGSS